MVFVFRLLMSLVILAWLPLLALGFSHWATGIQQQIDGTRVANSFPYETFGLTLMKAAILLGISSAVFLVYATIWRRKFDIASRRVGLKSSA